MQLNKWLGSDKPKKDDFNNDNQKIDDACLLLSQGVEKLEAAQKSNSYASEQAVTDLSKTVSSISASVSSLSSSVTSTSSSLTSHTGNSGIHATASEKSAWNSVGYVISSYIGDGNSSKTITLGYQPQFGFIFAAGYGIARAAWTSEQLQTYSGFMSRIGCSEGIILNSSGFSVNHTVMSSIDGNAMKFNASGVTYVYIVWK